MPFGYLEFLCAIGRKPCPHMRARAAAGGAGAGPGSGLALGSGSLPGPVLFEPGLMGIGYSGSHPLRHPDPNRISATTDRKTVANSWVVSV